jgi:hypothetical protein
MQTCLHLAQHTHTHTVGARTHTHTQRGAWGTMRDAWGTHTPARAASTHTACCCPGQQQQRAITRQHLPAATAGSTQGQGHQHRPWQHSSCAPCFAQPPPPPPPSTKQMHMRTVPQQAWDACVWEASCAQAPQCAVCQARWHRPAMHTTVPQPLQAVRAPLPPASTQLRNAVPPVCLDHQRGRSSDCMRRALLNTTAKECLAGAAPAGSKHASSVTA